MSNTPEEIAAEPTGRTVSDAARLGRQAALKVHDHDVDHALIIFTEHAQMRTSHLDLERFLERPQRPRGDTVVHDPKDFADVVVRHAPAGTTTVWCDVDKRRIVGVLNDQHADRGDEPGWRDHTVTLALQVDPEWAAWTAQSGKLVGQADFAEFLEEHTTSIVAPSAADLLEVATTFQATRGVHFKQGTRLSSGEVQLTFEESTSTTAGRRGQLEVPERITLSLAPYRGADPHEVTARVRWRIDPQNQQLKIGFVLLRPDIVERDAFDRVRQIVVENLAGIPTFLGPAPEALAPR